MDCHVRRAVAADAPGISRVVIAALRHTNAQDYDAQTIARIEASFSVTAILGMLARRLVLVAVFENEVVATASLEQGVVRSVFVDPGHQQQGIGKRLMLEIEACAIAQGLEGLWVPSSITAEGFYAGLGFCKVRDEYHGDERTIVMHKARLGHR